MPPGGRCVPVRRRHCRAAGGGECLLRLPWAGGHRRRLVGRPLTERTRDKEVTLFAGMAGRKQRIGINAEIEEDASAVVQGLLADGDQLVAAVEHLEHVGIETPRSV